MSDNDDIEGSKLISGENGADKKLSRKELKKLQKRSEYEKELKSLGSKLHQQQFDETKDTKAQISEWEVLEPDWILVINLVSRNKQKQMHNWI